MSKEPHLLDILPQNLKHDQSDNNVFKAIGDSEKKLYLRVDKSLLNDDNLEEQTMDVLTHLLWEEHLIKRREGLALSKTKKEIANLIKSSVNFRKTPRTSCSIRGSCNCRPNTKNLALKQGQRIHRTTIECFCILLSFRISSLGRSVFG